MRRTVEWRDEEAFLAQLRPSFRPRVELWNRTFTIPFHLFRHEVREIARQSLAAVRGAACVPWDAIPDGALVIPIDDDDWLAPEVVERLTDAHAEGLSGLYWISTYLEVPMGLRHRLALLRRRLIPSTPPIWTCGSNNYAFVKRPGSEALLRHSQADARFKAEPGLVRRMDQRLSVQNRTLASMTSLRWRSRGMGRAALLRKYRRYQALYGSGAPAGLTWAGPYVAAMADLMSRLHVRGAH